MTENSFFLSETVETCPDLSIYCVKATGGNKLVPLGLLNGRVLTHEQKIP
jgi:hypothetical protein